MKKIVSGKQNIHELACLELYKIMVVELFSPEGGIVKDRDIIASMRHELTRLEKVFSNPNNNPVKKNT